jgi:hypothetical protein
MAIPKSGSRKIVVDGVAYRWRVRPRATINITDYGGPLTFAAERDGVNGGILVAALPQNRVYWEDESGEVPATPRQVADVIRRAIRAGWKAELPGSPFQFDAADPSL